MRCLALPTAGVWDKLPEQKSHPSVLLLCADSLKSDTACLDDMRAVRKRPGEGRRPRRAEAPRAAGGQTARGQTVQASSDTGRGARTAGVVSASDMNSNIYF